MKKEFNEIRKEAGSNKDSSIIFYDQGNFIKEVI